MLSGWNRRMRTWRSNSRQLPARLSVAEGRALCFLVASAEAKPFVIREKEERLFPLPSTRNQFLVESITHSQRDGPPKGSRGRAESPLVASAEAKFSVIREKEGRPFPLPSTRNQFLVEGITHSQRDGPPEGVQGAIGKPPGRLRRGEILCATGKGRLFPLPSTRNQFLVGGFVRLRADEVLSITGKYPKGAGGGQRVHGTWPPPDPPLLRNNAPLASQGRAQLGSRPSLGGPLSPSRLAFTS